MPHMPRKGAAVTYGTIPAALTLMKTIFQISFTVQSAISFLSHNQCNVSYFHMRAFAVLRMAMGLGFATI